MLFGFAVIFIAVTMLEIEKRTLLLLPSRSGK